MYYIIFTSTNNLKILSVFNLFILIHAFYLYIFREEAEKAIRIVFQETLLGPASHPVILILELLISNIFYLKKNKTIYKNNSINR